MRVASDAVARRHGAVSKRLRDCEKHARLLHMCQPRTSCFFEVRLLLLLILSNFVNHDYLIVTGSVCVPDTRTGDFSVEKVKLRLRGVSRWFLFCFRSIDRWYWLDPSPEIWYSKFTLKWIVDSVKRYLYFFSRLVKSTFGTLSYLAYRKPPKITDKLNLIFYWSLIHFLFQTIQNYLVPSLYDFMH